MPLRVEDERGITRFSRADAHTPFRVCRDCQRGMVICVKSQALWRRTLQMALSTKRRLAVSAVVIGVCGLIVLRIDSRDDEW